MTFEEVVQTQLEEVRTPLGGSATGWPLTTLPDITPAEVSALQALSIYTVDDLGRYTQTPALLATLARQSGIAEAHLRGWVGAPFLTRIVPSEGAPGEGARIEGGNFGAQSGEGDAVLFHFHGIAAEVVAWSASALTVKVPVGATGPVYVMIGGAVTNPLAWTARATPQPPLLTLTGLSPATGKAGATLSVVLSGSGFASGMTVTFGAGITVQSLSVGAPGQATATLAIASTASTGARDVTGTGPLGAGTATLPAAFTVTAPLPPSTLTVTGVTPDQAHAETILQVTISGSGFQAGLAVGFGDAIQAVVESVAPTRVVVLLTISPQALGPRPIRIANPDGGKAVFQPGFAVIAPQK